MMNKSKGFTLIEVLVAGFILFLVLAGATEVYRGALTSSLKAERNLQASSAIPLIAETIKVTIREQHAETSLSGSGVALNTSYTWTATVARQANPPKRVDPQFGEIQQNHWFKEWQVQVVLSWRDSQQNYAFKVLSW